MTMGGVSTGSTAARGCASRTTATGVDWMGALSDRVTMNAAAAATIPQTGKTNSSSTPTIMSSGTGERLRVSSMFSSLNSQVFNNAGALRLVVRTPGTAQGSRFVYHRQVTTDQHE